MIGKEKSGFSFGIRWHLYAHKRYTQFVSYIQLKLLFLSIETTVSKGSIELLISFDVNNPIYFLAALTIISNNNSSGYFLFN